jgi:hypothetical protein
MATPGPIRQKIKARLTKTKAVAGQTAKAIAAPIKREAAVAANSIRQRGEMSDNTLGYVKKQATVSARKADRSKRRYENNVSNPTGPQFRGQGLPNKKRKAIATISENLNTNLQGRERKKLAKQYYADIKSKPKTDAEMRKQNEKKGKVASSTTCKPGRGANLCKVKAKNEGGF